MKVIIDENLSLALARALNALFLGEHEVVHIREKFGPSVKDADWIARLSTEGRWIVISGDARIAKRKTEQAAFSQFASHRLFLRPCPEWRESDEANAALARAMGRHRE